MEVVRNSEAEFCLIKQTESQRRFGQVKNVLALRVGYEQTVFYLEVARGDDDAGVGDGGAVGRNRGFRITGCLPPKTNGSQHDKH